MLLQLSLSGCLVTVNDMTNNFTQPSYAQPANDSKIRGLSSLIIGLASLFFGWFFIVPIIGLILGFSSRKHEPMARGYANWGIGLNLLVMSGWIVILMLFGLGAGLALFAAL